MTQILNGKKVAEALKDELKIDVAKLNADGVYPALGIVRLGEKPDDMAYERGAEKAAGETGVRVKKYLYNADVTRETLMEEIKKINGDDEIHGVLLLRPFPPSVDEKAVCGALLPSKDIDGVTEGSMAGVYSGSGAGYPPCTAAACIEILKHYGIDITGKRAAVIGRSLVIGKPVAMMLIKENATVTVCHTKTAGMAEICRDAEILVAAAGKAKSIDGGYFNKGQIIIDVGINVDSDGKLCGDVDFAAAEGFVKAITPVPGGVGAVTSAILMRHVVEAARKSAY